ncbi:Gfo/Idh/MocA family oxidoreductase [Streptomyces sp. NPDC046870]|uniref:Gfo/Idh/MocA family protein n=1 Tax=Streptomyces sp. NPDC046870 TaxID=3155135 RepID=UPI003454E366
MTRQTTRSPLRAALIGCGDAGTAHALTVDRCEGTELVAALDADRARAEDVVRQYGGRAVGSVGELLAHRPDIVITATGPLTQPELVEELAKEGFSGGLLCEKPLATGLAPARTLIDTASAAGITLAVNHQRRFGLAIQRAVRLAAEGAVGRLLRVECHSKDSALFDWGPHWIDISFLLAGDAPVTWVAGTVDLSRRREHAGLLLEHSGLLVWEHADGLRGQLECGAEVAGQPLMRLVGTEGLIEFGSVLPGPDGFRRGPILRVLGPGGTGWSEVEVGESALGAPQWIRSLEELVTALAEERAPAHSGERALRTLEVLLAGYRAARDGGRVELPADPGADITEVLGG